MEFSKSPLVRIAPILVATCLILGNLGLLLKRGLHPNLETATGLLWILSDYALRQKTRYPVAAPRWNAAGVILGSLLLASSGVHLGADWDWNRIRTPLGYIPAALIVGLQKELREIGTRLGRLFLILKRPFLLSALMNAYGVAELAKSAIHFGDTRLIAVSIAFGLATLALPLLDFNAKPAVK